ncbi:MAG: ChbG/HpnK family deacetylase [Acidimicrobiia bacterium]
MTRHLIVNADDLGRAPGINRGIAIAADPGIVTGASAMVCRSTAAFDAPEARLVR